MISFNLALRHTSNMAKCVHIGTWEEHLLRQRPPRHAPRSSALVAIKSHHDCMA